jgi:hypothetical protein
MVGEHKTEYFNSHGDCIEGLKELLKDMTRVLIGRGKNDKGYFIVYGYK